MNFHGFKDFFLTETSPVEYGRGIDELQRLVLNHYLFVGQTDDKTAWGHINESEGVHRDKFINSFKQMEVQNLVDLLSRAGDFSVVVCIIPKRWFKQLPKNNILGTVDQMMGFELPNNYIWGILSKVNHEMTRNQNFQFFRNPNYHANDDMFNRWSEKNLSQKQPAAAVDLNKAPRFAAPNFPR